jgi:hypothetical protein
MQIKPTSISLDRARKGEVHSSDSKDPAAANAAPQDELRNKDTPQESSEEHNTVKWRSAGCSECQKLECAYERSVARIFEVIHKVKHIGDKIHQLRRMQDLRDRAIEAFYRHKKEHPKAKRHPQSARPSDEGHIQCGRQA